MSLFVDAGYGGRFGLLECMLSCRGWEAVIGKCIFSRQWEIISFTMLWISEAIDWLRSKSVVSLLNWAIITASGAMVQ